MGPGDHEQETSSIWLVSILGGAPRRVRGDAYRATLSPDDSLVAYMRDSGIWLAESDGENPRAFITPGAWEELGSPTWSPDGSRILYRRAALTDEGAVVTIESRGLDEGPAVVLVRDANPPAKPGGVWARDYLMVGSRLVYARSEAPPRTREENLWEITVEPRTGEPQGEPRKLTDWVDFRIYDLSATADGSRIALLNGGGQADVLVGELSAGGTSLGLPRRLTLNDRDDSPVGWTEDGRAVVFASDRHGNLDLLVQGLDERDARDLVRGPGDQDEPTPTPDGRFFLYWESKEGRTGPNVARRLLRIPRGGGPTELVLEARGPVAVQCAATPEGSCFLIEERLEERITVISRVDPVAGRGDELWRLDRDPSRNPSLLLSPDGSRFAMIGHDEDRRMIRLLDAGTGEVIREVTVEGVTGVELLGAVWSPDGAGLYATGDAPRSVMVLRIDLQGAASILYENQTGFLTTVRPSPDGRHLAFGNVTMKSNAWLLEGF